MLAQLSILRNDHEILPEGWSAMGVIVHRVGKLRRSPRQTEEPAILRCNLDDLRRVLLAEVFPDQHVS